MEFIRKLWVAHRNKEMVENSSQNTSKSQGYLGNCIHRKEHTQEQLGSVAPPLDTTYSMFTEILLYHQKNEF